MIPENNIWHITPVNDLEEHINDSSECDDYLVINGNVHKRIECHCKCDPTIKYEPTGQVLIIHNSFDGREGVEQANEILKNTTTC